MNENDEIIREVRRIRREHTEKHGNDLRRIFVDLKARETVSDHELVEFPPRPVLQAQEATSTS